MKLSWTNDKTIIWLGYAMISSIAILIFSVTQTATPTILGITMVLLLLPLLLSNNELSLLCLIIVRPSIDTFSNYAIITIQDITLNMNAILSIVVLSWGIYLIIKERIHLRAIPGIWPLCGILCASGIALITSISVFQSSTELLRISSLFIFYILGYHFMQRDQLFLNRAINILALSAVLPMVVGIVQLITFSGLSFANLSNRIYGTFGHPNVLAHYLVLLITVTLTAYLANPQKNRSWIYPFVLLAGLFSILFTYTRGAWVGLAIVLVIFSLKYYRKPLLLVGGILCTLFIFGQSINAWTIANYNFNLNSIPLINRITSRNDEADSITWRLSVLQNMLPKTIQRPWFGYGLGNFVTLRKQGDISLWEDPEAHNDYLRIAVEIGFVGLGCYLLLWLSWFKTALQHFFKNPKQSWQRHYALGLLALLLAFFTISAGDNVLQSTPVMWSWLLLVGTLLGINFPTQRVP